MTGENRLTAAPKVEERITDSGAAVVTFLSVIHFLSHGIRRGDTFWILLPSLSCLPFWWHGYSCGTRILHERREKEEEFS